MAEVKPAEVSAILRQQLSGFKSEAELEEVGTVLQVGDGIARIYGLSKVQSGELIEFETGLQGIVLNLEEDNVGAVLLGARTGISEGSSVKLARMYFWSGVSSRLCSERLPGMVNGLSGSRSLALASRSSRGMRRIGSVTLMRNGSGG